MVKYFTTVCLLGFFPCLAMACSVTADCPFDALSSKHTHQDLTQTTTSNELVVKREPDTLGGSQAFDGLEKHVDQTEALERSNFSPMEAKPKVETWSPERRFDMLTANRANEALTETHDHQSLSMRRSTEVDWKPSSIEPLARVRRDDDLTRCN